MIIFGGSSCQTLSKEIADGLGAEFGQVTIKKFPDGERFLRVDSEVKGKDVAVVQSICKPHDENLVELLFLLDTLRDMDTGKITTVVPYYGYGRQDKRFNKGEVISSKTIAKHIQMNSDEFCTVNVHEKHIMDFFDIPSKDLDASPLLGEYFAICELESPFVIAPDKGALPLAQGISKVLKCDSDYLEKTRIKPGKVETHPKSFDVEGKDVIVVDDIIDSGGTILEAIKIIQKQNAGSIHVGCVHPILTGNVITWLFGNGATDVVATNTINSQISFITVSSLIIDALTL